MAFGLALGIVPAGAEEPPSTGDAERLLGEGMETLLRGLEMLLQTVPQYAAPEVLPNGDIIIRRVHPEEDDAPPSPDAPPKGDSTET
jgi:hypothetical protein